MFHVHVPDQLFKLALRNPYFFTRDIVYITPLCKKIPCRLKVGVSLHKRNPVPFPARQARPLNHAQKTVLNLIQEFSNTVTRLSGNTPRTAKISFRRPDDIPGFDIQNRNIPLRNQMHPQIRCFRTFFCTGDTYLFNQIIRFTQTGGIQDGHSKPTYFHPHFNDISGGSGDIRCYRRLPPRQVVK